MESATTSRGDQKRAGIARQGSSRTTSTASSNLTNRVSNTSPVILQSVAERAMTTQPLTRRNSDTANKLRRDTVTSDNLSKVNERSRSAQARRCTVSSTQAGPPRSTFKACLTSTDVPHKILEGVNVIKVNNIGKTKVAFLTLSQDKFTVYITTSKIKNNGRNSVLLPMLRRVTSIRSHDDEYEYERAIDVGSIIRIQKGQNTLKFELARKYRNKISSPKRGKLETPDLDSNKCFSIFFAGGRTVDFMVSDSDLGRDEIVDTLERLVQTYAEKKCQVGDDVILLRYIWLDVDKDKSDSINSSEFAIVLNRINYSMKRLESNHLYDKFSKMIGLDKSARRMGLSFEQCAIILHKVKRDSTWRVKPVREIFFGLFGEHMNNHKTRVSVSAESFLKKFMLKKQGESHTTMEDVTQIFRSLNELEVAKVAANLSLDGNAMGKYIDMDRFESYLKSTDNDVFDPAKEMFDHNVMNRPFSEFWIYSSHNTYLSGDQWKSMSSVEMYMEALYRGCRCLELDCWDGERDDSAEKRPIPDIYHGHTMTSRIKFHDVIEGIKVFLNGNPNCYPLVLSLENHCTIPFQETMARDMIAIFGDSLFVPDEETLHGSIPSAEELRGKVVLKGNRITESKESYYTDIESDSDDSEVEDNFSSKDDIPLNKPKIRYTKVSSELSRITYLHSIPVKNFEDSAKGPSFHMHSFSESAARKYCRKKDQRNSWIAYNQTHITRTYPSGRRVDSSNYSPMSAWSTGCQLVAINLQTPDYARRLNDGRFRENGGCGYVLKPPNMNGTDNSPPQLTIRVKVLAGYCLPKPRGKKRGECINPYVHICLYDVPFDGGREIVTGQYTDKVNSNGFNPIWNQIEYIKFKVQNPDVAMLQLSVWDKDVTQDAFIASSSIPVSCIREGYRSVKLFDANHTRSGSFECATLLIDVMIKRGEDVKMW